MAEVLAAPKKKRARELPAQPAVPPLRLVPPTPGIAAAPAKTRWKRLALASAALLGIALLGGVAMLTVEVTRIGSELRDQRVQQAWANLKQRLGGNTGKAADLSYLWAAGQSLDGLSLSCKGVGDFDRSASKCYATPRYSGLVMNYEQRDRSLFSGLAAPSLLDGPGVHSIDFTDARIEQARIEGMWFTRSKFDRVRITDSVVAATRLEGSFDRLRISNSVLTDSWIEGAISRVEIRNSDVSGLTFVNLDPSKRALRLKNDWAWADMPPSMINSERGKDNGDLMPLPESMLKSVRLCMPPLTTDGSVISLEGRRYPSEQNKGCQQMSLVASQFLFPEAYGISGQQRSWTDRTATAVAIYLSR